MPTQVSSELGFLAPPAAEGQAVGAILSEPEPTTQTTALNPRTSNCKSALVGNHPGLSAFRTLLPPTEGKVWDQAFAECHRVATRSPTPPYEGTAKLTRQPPVVIPPHSEMVLWLHVTGDSVGQPQVQVEPLPGGSSEWYVGRTLARLSKGRVPCRVCNPNPYPIEVPQRQALAQVTEVSTSDIKGEQELVLDCIEPDVVEVGVRRVGVEDEEEPHPVVSLQGEGLTGEQQKKMNSLLDRWRSVFSQHEEDFGRTNAVKHQIPTGSAPPSRERLPQLVMARTDNVSVEDGETWRERQAKDPELVQIRQWKEQGTTCPEARGERSLADLPRKDGPPKQRPDRGSPQAALLLAKND
uniref:Uncharacterized protein n=1 Tax=Knipowitschia caucasica TaxID=637954 RepID=A0AAV2MQT6_KNICA